MGVVSNLWKPEEFKWEVLASTGSDNKFTIFRIPKGKKQHPEKVFT